jgi:hypothetical protein
MVPVQGKGWVAANVVPAELLTVARIPIASHAEIACDERSSGWDFGSGLDRHTGTPGLIQSVTQPPRSGLRAWCEVGGITSSLCPKPFLPQPTST